jgi:hypothetical protein
MRCRRLQRFEPAAAAAAALWALGLAGCTSTDELASEPLVGRFSFALLKVTTSAAAWHMAEWAGPGLFVDGETAYWTGWRTECPGTLAVRRTDIGTSTLTAWRRAVDRGIAPSMTGRPCCSDCPTEAIRAAFPDREAVVAAIPSFRYCDSATGPFDSTLKEATAQMRQATDVPQTSWPEVLPPAVRVGIPVIEADLLSTYYKAPPAVQWPFPEIDLAPIRGLGVTVSGELAARVWQFCLDGASRWPQEAACHGYAFVPVESGGATYAVGCAPRFW